MCSVRDSLLHPPQIMFLPFTFSLLKFQSFITVCEQLFLSPATINPNSDSTDCATIFILKVSFVSLIECFVHAFLTLFERSFKNQRFLCNFNSYVSAHDN